MGFTHFNEQGDAIMVDVSGKKDSYRIASASGKIYLNSEAFEALVNKNISKGDVLGVARIAGIMAMKKTSDLIPLTHLIGLTQAKIEFELDHKNFSIKAISSVSTTYKTGVEMEALTGVSVALLTIYDMVKAIDKSMRIEEIKLLMKKGGKSDYLNEG